MADFTSHTERVSASGFAGLFGLFAGLCAIFAGCVALIDWHAEGAQARWPRVSAMVERAEVVFAERGPKDGGRTSWYLSARVRYEVNGSARATTVASRRAFSEAAAEKLQAWAVQLGNGSEVDVCYDPSRENRAAFASVELSAVAGRTRTDLIILAVAAFACIALLALARFLNAREARAALAVDGDQRGAPAVAVVVAAMGLILAGEGVYRAVDADPLTADSLMAVPAGLMFVFTGAFVGVPADSKWRDLLATLLVTCFALTFDWVAFSPGERQFIGSFAGFGFIPGEWVGRAVFGALAALLNILAIGMWHGWWRQKSGARASIPIASEQRL
jgi:hypothetical protein